MFRLKAIEPIEHAILAKGRVDTPELEALRRMIEREVNVDRATVDFLIDLYKRVEHKTPAFVGFVFGAIKTHLLEENLLEDEHAEWLRPMLFDDGVLTDEGRKLLHELGGEAINIGPEFDRFTRSCLRRPVEQHTCGRG